MLVATMSQTWCIILSTVTVLLLQLCAGETSCDLWSSVNGTVVQRGSSFVLYCTYTCKASSMYSSEPPTQQSHRVFNSTTIFFEVVNITEKQTFSCKCNGPVVLDPCGLDFLVGYPPDEPQITSCVYKVSTNESGAVVCSWDPGRETILGITSQLWTNSSVRSSLPRRGSDSQLTANFTVSSAAVQAICVWVEAENKLGSAASAPVHYRLWDIAMPPAPVLTRPNCSSRECVVDVWQRVRTRSLEVQFRSEHQDWTMHPHTGAEGSSAQEALRVSSLEPFRSYRFRARSRFSSGLWSEWSDSVSGQTDEEAPAQQLDVWYARPSSDLTSLKVYWKEADVSVSRGRIREYRVQVQDPDCGPVFSTNLSAEARNLSVPFCPDCEVEVWAYNSKGPSPPASITPHDIKSEPLFPDRPLEVRRVPTTEENNIALAWTLPDTAAGHVGYVVEWFPVGGKLEELGWLRVDADRNSTVITGLRQFECYEGAVCVVYNDHSMSRTRFTGVTTMESVPMTGPSPDDQVEGNKVSVSWKEIPRGQRGGCITRYTIYLESSGGDPQRFSVLASEQTYVIEDLPPAVYSLWMTASTAEGEGQKGPKIKFFIQHKTQLSVLLVCSILFVVTVILMCLCQSSAVKQRVWVYLQCLMLDVVPDPANSKWAKEYTHEKGKMDLQLQPSVSTVSGEEEEPTLVEVEELPKPSGDPQPATDASSGLLPRSSLTESETPTSPLTTYIKSFSHDSDSSYHTQTSLDTTVDYISSHLGHMDEEDGGEEDEKDAETQLIDVLGFIPSHNFMEPLKFGGRLTLDAVKIDCTDFFQNDFLEGGAGEEEEATVTRLLFQ